MRDYTERKKLRIEIRHTGECNAEQIAHFHEFSIFQISDGLTRTLEQDGEKLLQSTSIVRSWKQGEIIDELETRDDSFIMECVRKLHSER